MVWKITQPGNPGTVTDAVYFYISFSTSHVINKFLPVYIHKISLNILALIQL
jgi:hypothetical protein